VDVSVQPAIYSRGGDDQINDQIVPRSSLQFGPLSYPQMTAGVLLKQRLLMLLDSGLKNNLLRNKGLLHALVHQLCLQIMELTTHRASTARLPIKKGDFGEGT
jgi:hypothetical protein